MIERLSSCVRSAVASTAMLGDGDELGMKGRTNVDVGGVLQAGRELVLERSVVLHDFGAYAFPEPVAVSVVVERVGGGLAIGGTIDGIARGECGRCLDPVATPVHVEIDERFESSSGSDPFADGNVLSGDELDLTDLVRQLIDSALPLVLVCREDCAGLCATCGQKRDGTCRCQNPE